MQNLRFVSPTLAAALATFAVPTAFAQAPPPPPPERAPPPATAPARAPATDDAPTPPPAPAPDATPPSAATPLPPAPDATPPPAAASSSRAIAAAESFDELEASLDASPALTPRATAPSSPGGAPTSAGATTSMNPEIAAILDVAAAYFSEEDPLQAGAHDPNHTGFNWQQLEIALGGVVDPYLRFDANLVFSPFGVEVEEAYATTLDLPLGLQSRFGQFLTRFGRFNATHPHSWNFADQPFQLGKLFGGEGQRGLGVELSVLLPLPWSVELVGSATEAAGEATARSFFGARDLGVQSAGDLLYTASVKQFNALSDDFSLATGLSANFGPNASGRDNRTEIYGADIYIKYRPVDEPEPPEVALRSEWFYRRRQLPDLSLQDYGQFTELSYRFALRWAIAGRHELGSPSYDSDGTITTDPLDPEWIHTRQRGSASLSFFPTEFSRFRLQGSYDAPRYRDAIWAAFLTAEVVVGAHGAHQF